jgi:hypothetical protein
MYVYDLLFSELRKIFDLSLSVSVGFVITLH